MPAYYFLVYITKAWGPPYKEDNDGRCQHIL